MKTSSLHNPTDAPNINILWANLIVEECVRNGVKFFCVSPGSRSTPLVIALARHPEVETVVCIDERAAAFYALGYARAKRVPAALVCTSGTAVANYMPAIVEAAQDAVPMLVLTADRPPELRETGANQTITQPNIFGDFVRWKFDLPCPDEAITLAFVLTTIDHAIFRAKNAPAGAVHVNCMFREPLAPLKQPISPAYQTQMQELLKKWLQSSLPWTVYPESKNIPSPEIIQRIGYTLDDAKFPILAVGRLSTREEADAVMQCAYMWRIPIVADIASGLRLHDLPNTITYLDHVLLNAESLDTIKPDAVLHVGGAFVSKRLLQWLGSIRPDDYIVLEETPFRHDPNHHVTMRIQCDIPSALKALYKSATGLHAESLFAVTAFQYSSCIEETLREYYQEQYSTDAPVNEITTAMLVSRHIPNSTGLFLSNSMPVRDMDMYALTRHESGTITVGTNRGVSGIDGITATACGFARGLRKPVTLMIGDLALLHDLNSLVLVAQNLAPLIIIAVNNSGGGIFSFLPIATQNDIFEKFWGTQQNFSMQAAAQCAGIFYETTATLQSFEDSYKQALARAVDNTTSSLLEIRTHRTENVDEHLRLQSAVITRLKKLQA
jgi:2-succinyl-5-enolpyruvyl-6-hydroxy-3-cyclohexene-1-carboxylate synthase